MPLTSFGVGERRRTETSLTLPDFSSGTSDLESPLGVPGADTGAAEGTLWSPRERTGADGTQGFTKGPPVGTYVGQVVEGLRVW